MKKLLVITALLLFAGFAFGQTLEKGNILGLHVIELNLDPDVTYNQYLSGMHEYATIFNKEFQGDLEMLIAKADRGNDENSLGLIWLFKSAELRAKYFTEEGAATELFNTMYEKVNTTFAAKQAALGISEWSSIHYNDWIIQ